MAYIDDMQDVEGSLLETWMIQLSLTSGIMFRDDMKDILKVWWRSKKIELKTC